MPSPKYFEYWLRNYASQGILEKVNGILAEIDCNNMKVSILESGVL